MLNEAGAPTGIERCADGSLHRVASEPADPDVSVLVACEGTEDVLGCTTDADCVEGAFGVCAYDPGLPANDPSYDPELAETSCGCRYSCSVDADCDGGACLPAEVLGPNANLPTCRTGGCVTDADCASGECGFAMVDDGCGPIPRLACRSADDACRSDADCGDQQSCAPTAVGTWICSEKTCVDGRPLTIDGAARVAAPTGVGWADAVEGLPRSAPGAAAWAEVAAMEHASVASFARFVLQLQALGAPAELVSAAARAMADEVRHAAAAYGIASALGGADVGPGPLDLGGLRLTVDPAAIAREVVVDAAINETIAAAAAAWGASVTPHAAVARALAAVTEEEAQHAGLGWATLRWLLAAQPELAEGVRDAFTARTAALLAHRSAEPHLPEFGLPGGATRDAITAQTLRGVVGPMVAALLAGETEVALAA